MHQLTLQGIQTQVHYIPVYTHPYYKATFNTGWGLCPETEKYYARCLSIPLHPSLTRADIRHIIKTILAITGE